MLVLLPLSQPVRERVIRLLTHPRAVHSFECPSDIHPSGPFVHLLDIYQPEAESLTNVENTRRS